MGACHIHPQPICLDLGASWHVETWVFRLDVCMIPGSDITLHDLRQDAGRKFQALCISDLSPGPKVKAET